MEALAEVAAQEKKKQQALQDESSKTTQKAVLQHDEVATKLFGRYRLWWRNDLPAPALSELVFRTFEYFFDSKTGKMWVLPDHPHALEKVDGYIQVRRLYLAGYMIRHMDRTTITFAKPSYFPDGYVPVHPVTPREIPVYVHVWNGWQQELDMLAVTHYDLWSFQPLFFRETGTLTMDPKGRRTFEDAFAHSLTVPITVSADLMTCARPQGFGFTAVVYVPYLSGVAQREHSLPLRSVGADDLPFGAKTWEFPRTVGNKKRFLQCVVHNPRHEDDTDDDNDVAPHSNVNQ